MDCIYLVERQYRNDSSVKECHAQPFALENIYYKPTEEDKKKYCLGEGEDGFSFCPRFIAYQDHLEKSGKKPSDEEE